MKPFENLLLSAKTVAVVGLSRDPEKESHSVAKYLQAHGYKIFPVNLAADEILGEKGFRSLSEINLPVDVVDVFRPSEECGQIVKEAVKLKPKLVWLQLGIENEAAKKNRRKKRCRFCAKQMHPHRAPQAGFALNLFLTTFFCHGRALD